VKSVSIINNKYILKIITLIVLFFLIISAGIAAEEKVRYDNPVARFNTTMGTFDIELYQHAAPETVANFIGLAEGTKSFIDSDTGAEVKRRYYDGLIFHRVIDGFMIQGGCPLGDGTGGPGYQFADEMSAEPLGLDDIKAMNEQGQPHGWLGLRSQDDFNHLIVGPLFQELGINSQEELDANLEEFERRLNDLTLKDVYQNMGYAYRSGITSYQPLKGYLAMANRGPNTNGSQFFINLADTPWLTGKHTVFGKVISGLDVVEDIGTVQTNSTDKPNRDIVINSVQIMR